MADKYIKLKDTNGNILFPQTKAALVDGLANPNIIGSQEKLGDLTNIAVGYNKTLVNQTVTWDGSTEGKTQVEYFYKVSDATPTISGVIGKTCQYLLEGVAGSETITSEMVEEISSSYYVVYVGDDEEGVMIIVVLEPISTEYFSVPEQGIYFSKVGTDSYPTSLTYDATEIHKLPGAYIDLGEELTNAKVTSGFGYTSTGEKTWGFSDGWDVQHAIRYHHISNDSPDLTKLVGKTYAITDEIYDNGWVEVASTIYTIAASNISTYLNNTAIYRTGETSPDIIFAKYANSNFPKAGIYVSSYTNTIEEVDHRYSVNRFTAINNTKYKINTDYIPNNDIIASAIKEGGIGYYTITNEHGAWWDGDTTGRTPITIDDKTFYKIADDVPTTTQIIGGKVYWNASIGYHYSYETITSDLIHEKGNYYTVGRYHDIWCVPADTTISEVSVPKGIYSHYSDGGDFQDWSDLVYYDRALHNLDPKFASRVSVSSTGTATDEVQYITVNGVEKKLAGGSGGVTSITAGTGLTGGTITSTGTIAVDTTTIATKTDLAGKQDALTAGSNITISGNTISATDTTYTAGTGIEITSNEIGVDTDTVALKEDIPVGTLDVTLNGTATTFLEDLTNIVVGTTTYTIGGGGSGIPSIEVETSQISGTTITFTAAQLEILAANTNVSITMKDEDPTQATTYLFTKINGALSTNTAWWQCYLVNGVDAIYGLSCMVNTSTGVSNITICNKIDTNQIKSGSATSGQVLTANGSGAATWASVPTYTLPTASASTLGGIKVGSGLAIDANGVLSVNLPSASGQPF